jgi:hypothetical protein
MSASSPAASAPSSAQGQLEKFVFHPDRYTADTVPRGLTPAEVAEFVRTRIDRSTRYPAARQVEKLVDFYDVQEAGETLRKLLDRREVDQETLRRSVFLDRTVAEAGTRADHDFAKEYYLYLIRRVESLPLLEELVSLYEALGPDADVKPLRERITARIKALQPNAASDASVQRELAKLQDLETQTLARAEKANAVKATILKDASRTRRLDALVRTYLGFEGPYPEILQPWAARQLRREAWAAQPADQTTRTDDHARREEIVQAFARAGTRLQQDAKLSDEEKTFGRVRILRAIVFFGGQISEEDRQFVKEHGAAQVDTLSNDVPG